MNTQTEKILVESYYGKEIIFIKTTLKDCKISTLKYPAKVWQPADKKPIAPANGCDIIIRNSSTNTEDIFEFGGVNSDTAAYTLKKYDVISLYNYCQPFEVEQVELAHKNTIKELLIESNQKLNETIKQQSKILLALS